MLVKINSRRKRGTVILILTVIDTGENFVCPKITVKDDKNKTVLELDSETLEELVTKYIDNIVFVDINRTIGECILRQK